MAYLGKYETRVADFKVYTSSTATATHTLSWTPTSKQSLRITINGVVQQDDAFSLTGNTVTLDAAILVTDVLEIVGVNELGGQVLVPADGSIQTGKLGDNSVTLAKMAGGTDGNLITYDASGDPAHVATGTATHVLTSNGVGAAPTFQASAVGGKVLQVIHITDAGPGTTTTSATFVDTDTTGSITCSATSSKVLVMFGGSCTGYRNLDANQSTGPYRLYETVTTTAYPSTDWFAKGKAKFHGQDQGERFGTYVGGAWLHSPSSTSALTYTVQIKKLDDSTYWNETATETATMTLMEIGV